MQSAKDALARAKARGEERNRNRTRQPDEKRFRFKPKRRLTMKKKEALVKRNVKETAARRIEEKRGAGGRKKYQSLEKKIGKAIMAAPGVADNDKVGNFFPRYLEQEETRATKLASGVVKFAHQASANAATMALRAPPDTERVAAQREQEKRKAILWGLEVELGNALRKMPGPGMLEGYFLTSPICDCQKKDAIWMVRYPEAAMVRAHMSAKFGRSEEHCICRNSQ